MQRETYNSRLNMNPDNVKPGTLLRAKKWCRNNITIRKNGEYAIIVPAKAKYREYDVMFPSGMKLEYMAINWEVISCAKQ